MLLIVIALIVCGSLYPWHFTMAQANPFLILLQSWRPEWNAFTMSDAFLNVVVYVPLGALAFLYWARRQSLRRAAAGAILTGLLLSLAMELLQVFVPGRTSSLFDVACNVTGASLGTLAAWRLHTYTETRGPGGRLRQPALAPVLLLGCWTCYHLYPFVPSLMFSRTRAELLMWLQPSSFSFIEVWSYAAEWVALGVAVEHLFGRRGLRWLPAALAFHFVARPFIPARPLVLEEALGVILAVLLWNTLPEPLRSSPALLISAVLLRGFALLPWPGGPPAFSWLPFQTLIAYTRGFAVRFLSRAMFDYAAILWLWHKRGMSYGKGGAILAGALALLAAMQGYRYLPGDFLSMADPALALLVALILGVSTDENALTGGHAAIAAFGFASNRRGYRRTSPHH